VNDTLRKKGYACIPQVRGSEVGSHGKCANVKGSRLHNAPCNWLQPGASVERAGTMYVRTYYVGGQEMHPGTAVNYWTGTYVFHNSCAGVVCRIEGVS
jgi:hypothetical protein